MAIAGGSTAFSAETAARRAVWSIAVATGIASFAMNFWIPFIPLYMKDLGATSDANALFWMGLATGAQGIARIAAGPIWGVISDRYGRRAMFLRALFFASITMSIAAAATEPWHLVVALTVQGIFSGFNPAAVALTSVLVPDHHLNRALSRVTATQFLGQTIGPALSGILAPTLGFRAAIIGGALLPAVAGLYVMLVVPRDQVGAACPSAGAATEASTPAPALPSVRSMLTLQFSLVLIIWFATIALSQMLRAATPISLEHMTGAAGASRAVAIAFTLAGLGGVLGVLGAQRFTRPGGLRTALVVACVVIAASHLVLPVATDELAFIAAFAIITMLQSGMVPATNTLIAANAPRERRGTAFGLASAVQAFAFMVGPMAAAAFAVYSLNLGFIVIGVLFVALAVMIRIGVREPKM